MSKLTLSDDVRATHGSKAPMLAMVGGALLGKKTDDAGMLELLEPYAGQRFRVIRLIELVAGKPARRGSRMPVRDYRSF